MPILTYINNGEMDAGEEDGKAMRLVVIKSEHEPLLEFSNISQQIYVVLYSYNSIAYT